jgi:hypothetical protein
MTAIPFTLCPARAVLHFQLKTGHGMGQRTKFSSDEFLIKTIYSSGTFAGIECVTKVDMNPFFL